MLWFYLYLLIFVIICILIAFFLTKKSASSNLQNQDEEVDFSAEEIIKLYRQVLLNIHLKNFKALKSTCTIEFLRKLNEVEHHTCYLNDIYSIEIIEKTRTRITTLICGRGHDLNVHQDKCFFAIESGKLLFNGIE